MLAFVHFTVRYKKWQNSTKRNKWVQMITLKTKINNFEILNKIKYVSNYDFELLDLLYQNIVYLTHTTIFNPVVHFKVPYITSNRGAFLSPYITFECNIWDLWSLYITFESNIQVLWSPYITLKIYTGSKLDPACAK